MRNSRPPYTSSLYSPTNVNIDGNSDSTMAAAVTPSTEPMPPMTTMDSTVIDSTKPKLSGLMNFEVVGVERPGQAGQRGAHGKGGAA